MQQSQPDRAVQTNERSFTVLGVSDQTQYTTFYGNPNQKSEHVASGSFLQVISATFLLGQYFTTIKKAQVLWKSDN